MVRLNAYYDPPLDFRTLDLKLQNIGLMSAEAKEDFLKNAFVELFKNVTSRSASVKNVPTIQRLVAMASEDQTKRLLEDIQKNLKLFLLFGSAKYVLMTVLNKTVEFFDDREDNAVMDLVYQLSSAILKRTDLLCCPTILEPAERLLEVMSGMIVTSASSKFRKRKDLDKCQVKEHNYYSRFSDLLHWLTEHVLPMSASAIGMAEEWNLSILAGQLLFIFNKKEPEHCIALCDKMFEGGVLKLRESEGFPTFFNREGSKYICKVFIQTMPSDRFGKVYGELILPHMKALLKDEHGHCVVKFSIPRLHTEDQFKAICKVLEGELVEVVDHKRRCNVVAEWCEAAVDHPSWQKMVMKLWIKEIGDSKTNPIVAMCLGSKDFAGDDRKLVDEIREAMNGHQLHILNALTKYEDTSYLQSSFEGLPPSVRSALAVGSLRAFFMPGSSQDEGEDEAGKDSDAFPQENLSSVFAVDERIAKYTATNDEFKRLLRGLLEFKGLNKELKERFAEMSEKSALCLLQGWVSHYLMFVEEMKSAITIPGIMARAIHFFDSRKDNAVVDLIYQLGSIMLDHMATSHGKSAHILAVGAYVKEMGNLLHEKRERNFYSRFSNLLHQFAELVLPLSESTMDRTSESTMLTIGGQLLDIFRVKDPKFCTQLCQKMVDVGVHLAVKGSSNFPLLFADQMANGFRKNLIAHMSTAAFDQFFDEVLMSNFTTLLECPSNYRAIDPALLRIHTDEQFTAVFQCLKGRLFHCLQQMESSKLVARLCEIAVRCTSWQATIMDAWKEEMGNSKTNFIVAICLAGPQHIFSQQQLPWRIPKLTEGLYRILMAMATYEDMSYLCSSFAELSLNLICAIIGTQWGSNFIAFMLNSPKVPSETKTAFFSSPKDAVVHLICKSGFMRNAGFLRIWQKLLLPMKIEVMPIVVNHVVTIMATTNGKRVAEGVRLQEYISNRSAWDEWVVKNKTVRKPTNMADGEDSDVQPKKKKRKSVEAGNEDVKGKTTQVAKKKKKTVESETTGSDNDEMEAEVPETPVPKKTTAKKSRKSTGGLEDMTATPVASVKKSKKKMAKLSEDVQATEEVMSTPATSAKKLKKKTSKSAKK